MLRNATSHEIQSDVRVHIGPKIEMRVVTLGLDGAGKTAILGKLKQVRSK